MNSDPRKTNQNGNFWMKLIGFDRMNNQAEIEHRKTTKKHELEH